MGMLCLLRLCSIGLHFGATVQVRAPLLLAQPARVAVPVPVQDRPRAGPQPRPRQPSRRVRQRQGFVLTKDNPHYIASSSDGLQQRAGRCCYAAIKRHRNFHTRLVSCICVLEYFVLTVLLRN